MFGISQLRLYIYAGVAAAFIAVLSFAGCEHHRANAEESRADLEASGRETAVDANKAQQLTIDAQHRALTQWAKIGVSPEEVIQMLQDRAAMVEQLSKENDELKKLAEKDDANPDCVAFRQWDFSRVCPNRADVLRQYERRGQARAAEGSAGSGVRSAAEKPH